MNWPKKLFGSVTSQTYPSSFFHPLTTSERTTKRSYLCGTCLNRRRLGELASNVTDETEKASEANLQLCLASMNYAPYFGGAAIRFSRYMPEFHKRGVDTTVLSSMPRSAT